MKVKGYVFACMIACGALCADAESGETKASIQMKIEKLEHQKKSLEIRAKYADIEASRLLFIDKTSSKGKEWEANHCRKRMKEVDEEIKELKKKI
jgi:hypothetical protein